MFVRRERFGNLIWSDKDKAYFIANNKEILEKLPYVGEPTIKNHSHLFASISD